MKTKSKALKLSTIYYKSMVQNWLRFRHPFDLPIVVFSNKTQRTIHKDKAEYNMILMKLAFMQIPVERYIIAVVGPEMRNENPEWYRELPTIDKNVEHVDFRYSTETTVRIQNFAQYRELVCKMNGQTVTMNEAMAPVQNVNQNPSIYAPEALAWLQYAKRTRKMHLLPINIPTPIYTRLNSNPLLREWNNLGIDVDHYQIPSESEIMIFESGEFQTYLPNIGDPQYNLMADNVALQFAELHFKMRKVSPNFHEEAVGILKLVQKHEIAADKMVLQVIEPLENSQIIIYNDISAQSSFKTKDFAVFQKKRDVDTIVKLIGQLNTDHITKAQQDLLTKFAANEISKSDLVNLGDGEFNALKRELDEQDNFLVYPNINMAKRGLITGINELVAATSKDEQIKDILLVTLEHLIMLIIKLFPRFEQDATTLQALLKEYVKQPSVQRFIMLRDNWTKSKIGRLQKMAFHEHPKFQVLNSVQHVIARHIEAIIYIASDTVEQTMTARIYHPSTERTPDLPFIHSNHSKLLQTALKRNRITENRLMRQPRPY